MYFRPDGSVYLGFDDSGVFSQCGDSVVEETYRKFGGLVGRRINNYVMKFPDSTRAVVEFRGLPMELYHEIKSSDFTEEQARQEWKTSEYHFIKTNIAPVTPAYTNMKKKSWMWKDKKAFKAWKEAHKAR